MLVRDGNDGGGEKLGDSCSSSSIVAREVTLNQGGGSIFARR